MTGIRAIGEVIRGIVEKMPSATPLEDEALCRRTAGICGSHSGAAAAVRRMDELRAAGHDTGVLLFGRVWMVQEPAPGNGEGPPA